MLVNINGEKVELSNPPFAFGGEGELFNGWSEAVVKLYYNKIKQQPDWTARRQKVLALCNSHSEFVKKRAASSVAFPQLPAYDGVVSFDTLAGFTMSRYSFPELAELGFVLRDGRYMSSNGTAFDEGKAIGFVYQLFELIDRLHQARIVLGDISPRNFMWNHQINSPVIIDINSAQIGGFPCWSQTEEYSDPAVSTSGLGLLGRQTFDFGTDIFAAAMVVFQFLVGALPQSVVVSPPASVIDKKRSGVNIMRVIVHGTSALDARGVKYFSCKDNDQMIARLEQLRVIDPRLFDFFVSVFVHGERDNLLLSFPVTGPRHPANHFFVSSGMEAVIRREKEKRLGPVASASAGQHGVRFAPASSRGDAAVDAGVNERTSRESTEVLRARRADPTGFIALLDQFGLAGVAGR